MPLLTPQERLGTRLAERYTLLEALGEGGNALVYRARDERLARDVAVKLLKPTTSFQPRDAAADLLREARTLATLRHPHLVEIYDVDQAADETPYLVMELLQGQTLQERLLTDGGMAPPTLFELLWPVFGALAISHDRGVVHRDLKPGNLFLYREGGHEALKLLDFGIARAEFLNHSTTRDVVRGTPAYMAPEQLRAERCSPATDVWALGVVCFEVLSGRLPHPGDTAAELSASILHRPAPSLHSLRTDLPAPLCVVIDRALSKVPEARHPEMRSFARALMTACGQAGLPVAPHPDPVGLPDWPSWRRGELRGVTTRNLPVSPAADEAPVDTLREGATAVPVARAPMLDMDPATSDTLLASPLQHPTVPSAVVPISEIPRGARRWRWPLLVGLGALLGVLLLRGFGAPAPGGEPAPDSVAEVALVAAPETLHLRLRARPAGAAIWLDGVRVDNPLDVRLPDDGAGHQLRVRLAGHREVWRDGWQLGGDHQEEIVLASLPAPAPAPAPAALDASRDLPSRVKVRPVGPGAGMPGRAPAARSRRRVAPASPLPAPGAAAAASAAPAPVSPPSPSPPASPEKTGAAGPRDEPEGRGDVVGGEMRLRSLDF